MSPEVSAQALTPQNGFDIIWNEFHNDTEVSKMTRKGRG